jgi:RHS repeat-associated protein
MENHQEKMTAMKRKNIVISIISVMLIGLTQAQEVYYGDSFELNGALNANQSFEYKAIDFIHLKKGFQSSPQSPNYAMMEIDPYFNPETPYGFTYWKPDDFSNYISQGRLGFYPMDFDVNENGAAVISMPLEFPEGINGMTPHLSLNYNSQGGNGILGLGWSLGGMSKISRVPYTYMYDDSCHVVQFSNLDELSLDGVILRKGSNNGTVCYYPEIYDYSIVYPINSDGSIDNGFRVLRKDGNVYTYDAKYYLQSTINTPIEWHLSRVEDPFGNYIEYKYVNDSINGAFYPDTIYYTSHSGLCPKYEIRFEYDDERNDCPSKYFSRPAPSNISEGFSRITKKLESIQCWYDNSKIMSYQLTYKTLDWDIRALTMVEKQFFDCNGAKSSYNKLISTEFQWKETDYRIQHETLNSISLNTNYNDDNLWQQFTAFAARLEPYKLSNDTLEKYEHDIVHLMETGDGNHRYFMNVFRSNNHIGEGGQTYAYNEGELHYNCNNINHEAFGNGRIIVAFMPADTDGDGLDEIVCASYYPSWQKVSITLIKLNGSETFVESEEITFFPCSNINYLKDFTIADFNGDGLSDLFCLYDDTQTAYLYANISKSNAPFFSQISQQCYHYTGRKIVIGDFDGSKKDQIIMLVKQSDAINRGYYYHIFQNQNNQYSFSGPKDILEDISENYFAPNNCYRICTGDFNGDSKKDLLLLCSLGWRFYFSKGNGIFGDAVINAKYHNDDYVCTNETGTSSPAFMMVADFDNDGCDDFSVFKVKHNQQDTYKRLYRRDFLIRLEGQMAGIPNNIQVIKTGIYGWNDGICDSIDICIDSIQGNTTYYATYNPFIVIMGNHKGTSPIEIMSCRMGFKYGPYNIGVFLHNTGCLNNPPVRAINNITTSLGATTEIEYRPVSYQFTQNQEFGREEESQRDLFSALPFNGYMNIVERVRTETKESFVNDISVKTYRVTRYHFGRPYYHTRGRGFLGFKKVWLRSQGQDPRDDIVINKTFSLNTTFHILIPKVEKRNNFRGNQNAMQQFQQTDFVYQILDNENFDSELGQIPNDVFSPYLKEVITQRNDGSPILFEKEVFEKNGFGNIVRHEHRYGTSLYNFPFYEKSIITYEDNAGSSRWIIGVPQTEVLTQCLFGNGANEIVRHTSYQNNMNTGRHTEKCTEPGNEKQLTETYAYDGFGNLISTTASGSGETRTESVTYSTDGRFPIAKTNALGQTTTYTFDEATGRIESITDPNDLTTRYHYDILGNLIQTEYPSGVLEDQSIMWVGNSRNQNFHPDTPDFGGPIYFTYFKRSGERESYVFYDQHNRKLREVSCNMAGEKIYVDYKYYEVSGLLKSVSMPYLPGDAEETQVTNYYYDYLNRTIRIQRPDNSTMLYVYGGTGSSTTGFDGQKTELQYNKAGLVERAFHYRGNDNYAVITDFTYYGDGKVKQAKPQTGVSLAINYDYDINRNPLSITDPSLGELNYNYNAFGELVGSTTPRNETTYFYDALGRLIQRNDIDGNSYWTYDNGFIGALSNTSYVPTNGPMVIENYQYDRFGHLVQQTQRVGNEEIWSFDYSYNHLGKQSSITYPSGKKMKYHYNGKGFMDYVKDAATGDVLWQANASDRWDNISNFTEGDIDIDYSYDPVTGLVNSIEATRNDQILLNQAYHWTTTGNLDWRTDATLDLKESFGYDGFNRLTSVVAKNVDENITYFNQSFGYDNNGNITTKTGVGSCSYGNNASPYAITGLQPETGQEALFTHQEATYTSFDKLSTLSQDGKTLSVNYGIDRQRVMQTFSNGNTTRTKRYFTPLYETVTENGVTKKLHYLTSSTGLFAIFASYNNGGGTMQYTLKDHQGNLTATIQGNTVERLSYDAWGRRRNPVGFGYSNVTHTFDRGYTLHEHYDDFDLINMNGRLYDPVLGRMLSPDIAIQDEHNAQAYNRYSYCFNNPLRFTDPSGYFVRGSRNYYDWTSFVYYDFGNYRNNGSAFNTDLSEGKFSPVYDINGFFLGTDDEGLQGEAIVMRKIDFSQGMKHSEALALATDLADNNREEAEIRMYLHYASLKSRPDYDGFVTIDEGIAWAKSHMGALENPTPNNMLYINTSLLDFGSLSATDFEYGEGKVSFVDLFTSSNFIKSGRNKTLRSTVYALGKVHILLEDAAQGTISILNDCFNNTSRVTDYDWNGGGGLKRSCAIMLEKKRANIPNGAGFRVYYYGKGHLNR